MYQTKNASKSVRFETLENRQLMSTSLINGGVIDGKTASARQVNQYVFTATAGAQVQLDTTQSSSPNYTARFTLLNGTKQVDTWTGTAARIERNLAGGQYTLKVAASNGAATGSYSVGLEGISPISPKPLSLKPGGVVDGSITRTLDVKEYVFSANAGAQVQLDTQQLSSPNFTARFTLYDGGGRQVDTWTGTAARIERGLAGGVYMLKVNASNYLSNGGYSIGLEGLAPISPAPLSLSPGGVIDGSIDRTLDVKQYVFNAAAGAQVQLNTFQGSSAGFTTRFTLYDAIGQQIDTWTGTAARIERNLAGGQYMLKVNASNYLSTGTFSIGLEGIAPVSPAPLTLASGQTAAGSIWRTLDVEEFVFHANMGSTVQLSTTQSSSPGFTARFTLYDGAGNQVDTWTGSANRIERNLAGGDYLLKVNASNYVSTGSFSATLI